MSHMQNYSIIVPRSFNSDELRLFFSENYHEENILSKYNEYEVNRIKYNAEICAKQIKENGNRKYSFFGPFATQIFRKGQKIRIKKGAEKSCSVSAGLIRESRKSQVVTVHCAFAGWVSPGEKNPVRQPEITWIGSGGAYYSVNPEDVDLDYPPR